MTGSERQNYVTSLVQLVIAGALAAGAPLSAPYIAAYNTGTANLLTQAQALGIKIQGGGNALESVSIPGQSSKWVVSMSLQEQQSACIEAWNQLQGNNMIVRRTSARFFN